LLIAIDFVPKCVSPKACVVPVNQTVSGVFNQTFSKKFVSRRIGFGINSQPLGLQALCCFTTLDKAFCQLSAGKVAIKPYHKKLDHRPF
jgi:hypothetical protein